jgi:pimeloyl-ACP methyl ester carboxylesterase
MPRSFHQIALGLVLFAAAPILPLIAANPAAAGITPFPGSFHAQQMPVTGGTQYVRIGGQGQAVLLLHGFGDTGDMWEPLAAVLVRDHTVIVPDCAAWAYRRIRNPATKRSPKRVTSRQFSTN